MPAATERIRQMHKAGLLSMAGLLDVCAIFSAEHLSSCQAIASACWQATDMAEQAATLGAHTADNLTTLRTACCGLVLPKDLPELSDAAAYLLDTCATLVATLSALPAAAPALLAGSSDQLPQALAAVHDALLPHIQRIAHASPDSPARSAALARLQPAGALAARAVQLLVVHGLLASMQQDDTGPSTSAAKAEGGSVDDAAALGERVVHQLMELQARFVGLRVTSSSLVGLMKTCLVMFKACLGATRCMQLLCHVCKLRLTPQTRYQ